MHRGLSPLEPLQQRHLAGGSASQRDITSGQVSQRPLLRHSSARHAATSSSDGGEASQDGESDGAAAAAKELEAARARWKVAIGGEPEHLPPHAAGWYRWLGKHFALHHLWHTTGGWLEEDYGKDGLEAAVTEGAKHCLRFLAKALEGASNAQDIERDLEPPHVEEALGGSLLKMAKGLRSADSQYGWTLHSIDEAHLHRLFLIMGASRRVAPQETGTYILAALGQQFVLSTEQKDKFVDGGARGRMEVLQDALFTDLVLVADVTLSVTQESFLRCPPSGTQVADDKDAGHAEHTADAPAATAVKESGGAADGEAVAAAAAPSGAKDAADAAATAASEAKDAAAAPASEGKDAAAAPASEAKAAAADAVPGTKDTADSSSATSSSSKRSVQHVLRLELELVQRDRDEKRIPNLRPSGSWLISDWNWICSGNHPSIPRGKPAPW